MKNRRVIIIANGDLIKPAYYRDLIADDDYIICVNGGSIHALSIGVKPDLLIGDLDSLPEKERKQIMDAKPELIEYSAAKDKSDLELAVDYAIALNPGEIIIIGALGGARVDHELINIMLLLLPMDKGIPARILDETQQIYICRGSLELDGSPGDYLSLFALTGNVEGVTTEGLIYHLQGETLNFASSRGLSNEFTATQAFVSIKSGLLLVIKTTRS
jgi:thiamine pyrophosphokinase